MKQNPQTLRIAIVALSASAALSTAPVYGQEAAPVSVAPPPPPVATAPPPAISVTPPAAARPAVPAPTLRTAPAPAPTARTAAPAEPAARRATRTVERSRAPAARSAPATSAAPAAAAPAATPTPAPAPAAEMPAPVPAETPAAPVDTGGNAEISEGGSNLMWLIAGGVALLLAAIAFLAWRRRRAAEEDYYYDEPYEEQVVVEPVADTAYRPETSDYQPQIVAPVPAFRREAAEPRHEPEVALRRASEADLEALAAASDPDSNRPWLEFLMRPVRAGTSGDEALVEFELTVGNTGSAPAEDVRISTWMLAGGTSEMESSLIEPPAAAATSETRIEAGDGTRVEARIAVPREQLAGDRLPVVVADARYRLPDGGEGRTAARFAVGLPSGDGLAPFAVELGEGLRDDVEVRLEGEPERV